MPEATTVVPVSAMPSLSDSVPSVSSEARKGSNLETAFSGLDKFAKEPSADPGGKIPDGPGAPKKAPTKAQEAPSKPPEAPSKELDAAKAPIEDDPPKEPAKEEPGKADPAKPKRPSDFMREEIAKQKQRADALEAKLKALEAPKEDPEKVELKTKFESTQKQAQELENKLRQVAYEQSQEYTEKYLKPFQDAVAVGRNKIKALDVVERTQTNQETGEVKITQKGRPATEEDFDAIMLQPDDRVARNMAKQMFGEDYMVAIHHREKVMELNSSRHTALETYKKNGAEIQKQMQEQQATQQKQMQEFQSKLRETHFEDFKTRYPEVAAAAEGDKDAETILEQDRGATDILFKENNLPKEKLVQLHAEMRNRAAHYGHLNHKFKLVQKENSELKEKLKQYEGSEPGPGTGAAPKTNGAPADSMAGVLADLERRGKPAPTTFY